MGLKRVVVTISIAFLFGMIASVVAPSFGVGVAAGTAVGIYELIVVAKEN